MTNWIFNGLTLSYGYTASLNLGGSVALGNYEGAAGAYVTAFGGQTNNGVGLFYSVGSDHPNPNALSLTAPVVGFELGERFSLTIGNVSDFRGDSVNYSIHIGLIGFDVSIPLDSSSLLEGVSFGVTVGPGFQIALGDVQHTTPVPLFGMQLNESNSTNPLIWTQGGNDASGNNFSLWNQKPLNYYQLRSSLGTTNPSALDQNIWNQPDVPFQGQGNTGNASAPSGSNYFGPTYDPFNNLQSIFNGTSTDTQSGNVSDPQQLFGNGASGPGVNGVDQSPSVYAPSNFGDDQNSSIPASGFNTYITPPSSTTPPPLYNYAAVNPIPGYSGLGAATYSPGADYYSPSYYAPSYSYAYSDGLIHNGCLHDPAAAATRPRASAQSLYLLDAAAS